MGGSLQRLRDVLRSITGVAPVTRRLHGDGPGARHGEGARAEMNMTIPLVDGYHMPAEWETHERCVDENVERNQAAGLLSAGLERGYVASQGRQLGGCMYVCRKCTNYGGAGR